MTKIIIHTEEHPEDNAMLQGLYSRSNKGVAEHIKKLESVGSGDFMSKFFIGYNHASLGDCGFITIYLEGVSMLAAKAIQDNPLYNGQESSSRYIDWSDQPFYNPYVGTEHEEKAERLLNAYRVFYTSQKPVLIEHLTKLYPKGENEKQNIYEKAIAAKAFDILRGFLPCGATTNVSWTTSLRKANEHVKYLSLHPLKEVREIAHQLNTALLESYPNSIQKLEDNDKELLDDTRFISYYDFLGSDDTFYGIADKKNMEIEADTLEDLGSVGISTDYISSIASLRPRYGTLPKHFIGFQEHTLYSLKIDFGSYRDLQRHRAGYCTTSIIDNQEGFHPWYLEQLPTSSAILANEIFSTINNFLLETLKGKTNGPGVAITKAKIENQYLLPLGTVVQCVLHYNIHQAVYVSELRSGQTVHPTLRPIAQQMGKYLEKQYNIKMYNDTSESEWNLRRGTQDITTKLV